MYINYTLIILYLDLMVEESGPKKTMLHIIILMLETPLM